jgi:hypothetical protein
MRKIIGLAAWGLLSLGMFAEVPPTETLPVALVLRAMDTGRFADDLKLEEISLSEDGRPQTVEALVLVRNGETERREGLVPEVPETARSISLIFYLTRFRPRVEEALKSAINVYLRPGDRLQIRTLKAAYTMSPYALDVKSKEALVREVTSIVRRDTEACSSVYDDILTSLKLLSNAFRGSKSGELLELRGRNSQEYLQISDALDRQLPRYRQRLEDLERLRSFDPLMAGIAAEENQPRTARNSTVLFYEHPLRPELSFELLSALYKVFQANAKILAEVDAVTQIIQSEAVPDAQSMQRAFIRADEQLSVIDIPATVEEAGQATMQPVGEKYFSVFAQLARATGGTVESGGDAASAFQKIADRLGAYYLLYYQPANTARDGAFRTVRVVLKNRACDLDYRRGYYADK